MWDRWDRNRDIGDLRKWKYRNNRVWSCWQLGICWRGVRLFNESLRWVKKMPSPAYCSLGPAWSFPGMANAKREGWKSHCVHSVALLWSSNRFVAPQTALCMGNGLLSKGKRLLCLNSQFSTCYFECTTSSITIGSMAKCSELYPDGTAGHFSHSTTAIVAK